MLHMINPDIIRLIGNFFLHEEFATLLLINKDFYRALFRQISSKRAIWICYNPWVKYIYRAFPFVYKDAIHYEKDNRRGVIGRREELEVDLHLFIVNDIKKLNVESLNEKDLRQIIYHWQKLLMEKGFYKRMKNFDRAMKAKQPWRGKEFTCRPSLGRHEIYV